MRVLKRGFSEKLAGRSRPCSVFARRSLTRAGHVPAQEKIRQLQTMGATLYTCGPSMQHFGVAESDLISPDITVCEHLPFTEMMSGADIRFYV